MLHFYLVLLFKPLQLMREQVRSVPVVLVEVFPRVGQYFEIYHCIFEILVYVDVDGSMASKNIRKTWENMFSRIIVDPVLGVCRAIFTFMYHACGTSPELLNVPWTLIEDFEMA